MVKLHKVYFQETKISTCGKYNHHYLQVSVTEKWDDKPLTYRPTHDYATINFQSNVNVNESGDTAPYAGKIDMYLENFDRVIPYLTKAMKTGDALAGDSQDKFHKLIVGLRATGFKELKCNAQGTVYAIV